MIQNECGRFEYIYDTLNTEGTTELKKVRLLVADSSIRFKVIASLQWMNVKWNEAKDFMIF